jgi:hypothetical protein
MEVAMRNRSFLPIIGILIGFSLSPAYAVEFPQSAPSGPPLCQSPSGFIGVPGPGYWEIERAGRCPPPPQAQASAAQPCSNCTAQTQGQAARPTAQQVQR